MIKEFAPDETEATYINPLTLKPDSQSRLIDLVVKPLTRRDIGRIRSSRKSSASMGKIEWPISHGNSLDYYRTFQDLFRDVPIKTSFTDLLEAAPDHHLKFDEELVKSDLIRKIAERKRELTGNVAVLDAMGYGTIAVDLDATGVAIGLEPRRSSSYIKGDILSIKTWQALNSAPVKEFDMIFCRPQGPVSMIPLAAYKSLFERAYEKLSSDDGIFLSQVATGRSSELVEVVSALNELPGVFAKLDTEHDVFMLIKQKAAPEKLY